MGGGPSENKMDKGKAAGLTARVSVPYPTKWGQSVRLVGEGVALGEWQPSRGLALECTHKDGALIWSASLALPKATELTYKYVVVNEGGAMEDAETRPRTVQLPTDLPPGAAVLLADEWQVRFPGTSFCMDPAFRSYHMYHYFDPACVVYFCSARLCCISSHNCVVERNAQSCNATHLVFITRVSQPVHN